MGTSSPVQMIVSIDADALGDPERVDAETRRLRREIAELDVESVQLPSAGDVPAGAKSGEAVALGTLLVTVLPAVVPKLIDFLQAWTLRDAGRTVKIRATAGERTFDLEYSPGTTSESQLKELVTALSTALGPTGSA